MNRGREDGMLKNVSKTKNTLKIIWKLTTLACSIYMEDNTHTYTHSDTEMHTHKHTHIFYILEKFKYNYSIRILNLSNGYYMLKNKNSICKNMLPLLHLLTIDHPIQKLQYITNALSYPPELRSTHCCWRHYLIES